MPKRIAKLALIGGALAAAALLCVELYRGAPLWGTQPGASLLAALGAGLLLLREVLLVAPRRPAAIAGLLSFALFVSNGREVGSGDTMAARILPYHLLRHGTLSLDPMPDASPQPYWVAARDGRRWSEYPVAPALLALPLFVPAALGPGAIDSPEAAQAAKLAAALMAALSVVLVLSALLLLGVPRGFAFLVTALFAAASPVLSISSQALWQHGPGALGLAGMVWALLKARTDSRFAWAAGAFAGLACAARPTNVVPVAALGLAALLEDRPRALRLALAAAVPLGLVALYDTWAFGAPWRTGYDFTDSPGFGAPIHSLQLLISPTRGLVTFVPWSVLAVAGWVIGARAGERIHAAMGAGFVGALLLTSAWSFWWGGWTYGPRLLADLTPLLALGLAPLAVPPRRWVLPSLAITGAIALFLHVLFAFGHRTPMVRAVIEIGPSKQAMEWQRYPLVRPFTSR